jgi:hypothetical protein
VCAEVLRMWVGWMVVLAWSFSSMIGDCYVMV